MLIRLKPEVKEKWVAALRSGDYAQGKHRLITYELVDGSEPKVTYCCLGVLCEIAAEAGVVTIERPGPTDYHAGSSRAYVGANADDKESLTLPLGVVRWAYEGAENLAYDDVNFCYIKDPSMNGKSASNLNDIVGASFDEIASEIDRWL